MMSDQSLAERFQHEGLDVFIHYDPEPQKPDEWAGDDLFLVAFHRQFHIVRDGFNRPEDEERWAETHWVFPLRAYIHSGVALSLGRDGQFGDQWDSCWVGRVLAERSSYETKDAARKAAESLVDEWNTYLSGQVYGYVIQDPDGGEHLDSCWGLAGLDHAQAAACAAAEAIAGQRRRELEAEEALYTRLCST